MIELRGQKFSGYNKPKRTPGATKKYAVAAKVGTEVRLVRFGDPKMKDYLQHGDEKRRANFQSRMGGAERAMGRKATKHDPIWWARNYSW
jgi:Family of unknown function (DUF5754)